MEDYKIANSLFQFILVFVRLGVAFSLFPGFKESYLLPRGRVTLALLISIIIYPIVNELMPVYSEQVGYNLKYLLIEFLIGFIIAFASNCYFAALTTIGQIVSMQSGIGSATFFDPSQRTQVAVFTNLLSIITVVFLFITETHYLFIKSLIESYSVFPPGEALPLADIADFISHIVNDSFILAFKISSPFIIVSTVMLVGGAVLARLMPNLQIFFIMTPAQILCLFATLYVVINIIVDHLITAIQNVSNLSNF